MKTTLKNIRRLLEELLSTPFDMRNFTDFAGLFSCDPGISAFNENSENNAALAGMYSDIIGSLRPAAVFTCSDGAKVGIIAVRLNTPHYTGFSGIAQRSFLSRLLAVNRLDAAIAAFYRGDAPAWILSFARFAADFDVPGAKQVYTAVPAHAPVYRSSFPAGGLFPSFQAQMRLFRLFRGHGRNPSLQDLERTFSQDEIAGEFINECKKLPDRAKIPEILNRYGFLVRMWCGGVPGRRHKNIPGIRHFGSFRCS